MTNWVIWLVNYPIWLEEYGDILCGGMGISIRIKTHMMVYRSNPYEGSGENLDWNGN